ncbi:hypothetical protein PIB30_033876 [Stylosanthes scabra]|uniref:Uncharacterized protein n=1 Tax=Stylosanthes scabra TaxID=79078 RepID=A0ABU6TEH0_9FABA|nr:hypothetical protein [Stylosanthes scabra]
MSGMNTHCRWCAQGLPLWPRGRLSYVNLRRKPHPDSRHCGWRERAPPEGTLGFHVGSPALYSVTKPVSEEKLVIEISDDSVQKEDTNLEQNEGLPVAEGGAGEDLPKNDVYDALWAMLDAESEAEGIPGEWDLDSVLQNWGRNKPDVGPVGPDQGPPLAEI